MRESMNHSLPELLAPAGDLERLKMALHFGADAVYLALERFGMRAFAGNFTPEGLRQAVKLAHDAGAKVHVTCNTLPRDTELKELPAALECIQDAGADAVIAADFGVMQMVKRYAPRVALHVSTQFGVVNSASACALHDLGAERVVLARELSLEEIKAIRRDVSPELELETFVHGAMCVSYSGRCLLSNHFTGRDGNRGECTQPCRWNYKLYELHEEKDDTRRPGVEQTEDGTFIMSSKDMCMIEHIPELCEAGITSFKIEGRMKSVYYAAVTALAYRRAVEAYANDPSGYRTDPELVRLLGSVTHRKYDTGYYFSDPSTDAKTVDEPGYITERPYYGIVQSYDESTGTALVKQKNKVLAGQTVRFLSPDGEKEPFVLDMITDEDGQILTATPHPKMIFGVKTPYPVGCGDILH